MLVVLGALPAAGQSLPAAATVAEALQLSLDEQLLVADTHDGSSQLDEPGFYVLLSHAAALPVGPATLGEADAVQPENLLRYPLRYRARLVRLDVHVWRITKWQGELNNTRWWGDRPVWRLDCTVAEAGDKRKGVPLMVVLTRLPPELSEGVFPAGLRFTAAGLFYKTVHLKKDHPVDGEPAEQDYPVLLGNAVYPPEPIIAQKVSYGPLGVLAAMIVVLIVGYVLAKRYSSRRPKPSYRALRAEFPPAPPSEEGQAVDSELQREIEEYKKRHHPEDHLP